MKIFVIHARRTAYGIVRALCRETKNIYAADVRKTELARSRYVKEFFVLPEITKTREDEFLALIIDLAKRMHYSDGKPLVFTGKDDYLLFFAKHSKVLLEYFDYSFESNYDILRRALDKVQLAELAQQIGVPVPKFRTSSDANWDELRFPVIIKPAIKNLPEIDVVDQAFRLRVCNDTHELAQAVDKLRKLDVRFIIQDYIPGDDSNLHTLGAFSYEGELLAWSTSKKVRQFPPDTGECSYGVTTRNEQLVPLGEKLLRALGKTGISQIEFKEFEGKYYLMEVNPRVWSWHQIHSKVGVDFARLAHRCIVLKDFPSEVISPTGRHASWQFFMMDLLHNRLLNNNITYRTLLRDFLTADLEAFWNWKDPWPFFLHATQTVSYIREQLADARAENR